MPSSLPICKLNSVLLVLLQFLLNVATEYCVELAKDRQGCCIIQKCIIHGNKEQKNRLLYNITSRALELAEHQYGYVHCLQSPSNGDSFAFNANEHMNTSLQELCNTVHTRAQGYLGNRRNTGQAGGSLWISVDAKVQQQCGGKMPERSAGAKAHGDHP